MQNFMKTFFSIHSPSITYPKDLPLKQKPIFPNKKTENLLKFSSAPQGTNQIPGRHDYHEETEKIVNDQIQHELNASHEYLALAAYFGRTDVALPGTQGYFFNMHIEEHEHAMIFTNFQLMRGGQVHLKEIVEPKVSVKTVTEAFKHALCMEIFVKERLMEVMCTALKHNDLQLQDLITTDFMDEQNKSICELGRLVERSKISDTPLGEYLFDKMVFSAFVKKHYNKLMHKRRLVDEEADVVYK